MLASISAARDRFRESMSDGTNLVAIHRELNQAPGRRTREIALDRAIVVLSVAAWQALVQNLAQAALDQLSPPASQPRHDYNLLKATVKKAIFDFATPNAENTQALFMRVGFDPWPHWHWQEGPVAITPAVAQQRLNQWLKVRHAIAHGHAEWPDVEVLSQLAGGGRSLRLGNCEHGIKFLHRLCDATSQPLNGELQAP